MNQSVINNLAAKINSKEQKSNKVASWNSTPSDDKYPSEKLVKDSLDGKANSTHYHGNLQNNGQVGGTAQPNKNVVTNADGLITTEDKPNIPSKTSDLSNDGDDGSNVFIKNNDSRLSDARTPTAHNQASSTITDSHTYTNIGNVTSTQESINSAIDTKLGQLSNINAINVVSTLPSASSSTMGKLYIISEYGVINVYYTEEDNGSYSWHEMDADILDELSIDWIDIVNNPFGSALPEDYATSSHSHGYITSDGKIGSSSGYLLITSTGGTITSAQTISSSKIKDSNAHSNIGSSANDTQSTINSAIDTALDNKVNISDLGAVALSNSYNDLTNKPNIPSASNTTPSADTTNGSVGTGTTWAKSDHTHPKSSLYASSTHTHSPSDINSNMGIGIIDEYDDLNSEFDSNFDSSGNGAVLFDSLIYSTDEDNLFTYDESRTWSKIATLNDIPNINSKENVSNKVTSLSSSSTDTQYPSAKLVKDSLDLKADKTTTLDTTNLSAYVENKFLILTDEEDEEMITIGCGIIWSDQNNSSKARPLSVKCTLSDSSQYILSNINDWNITIQVPKYNSSNEEIQYTWSIASVLGYGTNTTVNNNITTFTLSKSTPSPNLPT